MAAIFGGMIEGGGGGPEAQLLIHSVPPKENKKKKKENNLGRKMGSKDAPKQANSCRRFLKSRNFLRDKDF
jgi:hypothetical protein